jgi:hypothetical protein
VKTSKRKGCNFPSSEEIVRVNALYLRIRRLPRAVNPARFRDGKEKEKEQKG